MLKRIFVAGAFALLTAPAYAVDLTVDLSTPIMTATNTQKLLCMKPNEKNPNVCDEMVPMTIGNFATTVLSMSDSTFTGDQKAHAGALAITLAGTQKHAFTLEEATLLKRQVDKFADPVTDARIRQILDPNGDSK